MNGMKKRIAGLFLAMVFILTMTAVPVTSYASGNGEVIVGNYTVNQYLNTKTLDLSESDIDIVVSQEEKDALMNEAKESVFRWLWATTVIDADISTFRLSNIPLPSDVVDDYADCKVGEYGLWKKHWWEAAEVDPDAIFAYWKGILDENDVYDADTRWVKEGTTSYDYGKIIMLFQLQYKLEIADKIAELGDLDSIIGALKKNTLSLEDCIWGDETDGSNAELLRIIESKVTEVYNDKLGEVFAERASAALPVKVDFALVPLAEDGSDDEKAGLPAEGISKGVLDDANGVLIDTVDFGAPGQLYDEVLNEGVEYSISIHEEGNYTLDFLLSDGRDLADHLLFINGGVLYSSDGSQLSYGYDRDNEGYPGWHSLLEVADSLATYSVWRYGIPEGGKYVQTFNLHLNPAVTYITDILDKDLITGATFDADGRVLTISKPINISFNADAIVAANPDDGVYRFKLVEKDVYGDIDTDKISHDDTEYIVDVEVVNGRIIGLNIDEDYIFEELKPLNNVPSLQCVGEKNEFVNKIASTEIYVTKKWDDADDKDGYRIPAADFASYVHLYAGEGDNRKEVEAEPVVTDNGNGSYSLVWSELPKYDGNGEVQVYTVEEDAIENYETPVIEGNQDEGFIITNKHEPEPNPTIKISKVDLYGYELSGAEVQVLDASGNEVDSWTSGNALHEVEVVAEAEYTFHEEAAPFGYTAVTDIKFKADKAGKVEVLNVDTTSDFAKAEDGTLIVTDSRDLEGANEYFITKTDEKGNPLPGAKMQLKDKNGNVTYEWISTKEPFKINVKPSDYYILEVEAPRGYQKIETIRIETDENMEMTILRDKGGSAVLDDKTVEVIDFPEGYVPPEETDPTTETKPEEGEPTTTPAQDETTTPADEASTTSPKQTTKNTVTTKKTTSNQKSPKTGDTTNTAIYIVLLAATAGTAAIVVRRRRKDG